MGNVNKMMVFSSLRSSGVANKLIFSSLRHSLFKTPLRNELVKTGVRNGSERKMVITPSRFEWVEFKDMVNFNVWLAVIPMVTVVTLSNLFYGQAALTEIPDDYRPKPYEYYKQPLSRFFCWAFHHSAEAIYEQNLHQINIENEKRKLNLLWRKVKQLSSERQDSKNWIYIPAHREQSVYAGYYARQRELADDGLAGK